MRQHLWVVEWRDPKDPRYGFRGHKRWECSGGGDAYAVKRDALDDAKGSRSSGELEYRVTKYVPEKPKEYIGY